MFLGLKRARFREGECSYFAIRIVVGGLPFVETF